MPILNEECLLGSGRRSIGSCRVRPTLRGSPLPGGWRCSFCAVGFRIARLPIQPLVALVVFVVALKVFSLWVRPNADFARDVNLEMARRSLCPVCYDVLAVGETCVKQCTWPPEHSMKKAPPMARRRTDLVGVVGRSDFDWPLRPPELASTRQNEPEGLPAEAFACLTDDSLASTTATLRQMLQIAERELSSRQVREDAKRDDGSFAFLLSKIRPVAAPRFASCSEEVEDVAKEAVLRSHPLDVGEYLKSFGFVKVRRLKFGRNVYFYKFSFDCCARPEFVQVINYSSAGE